MNRVSLIAINKMFNLMSLSLSCCAIITASSWTMLGWLRRPHPLITGILVTEVRVWLQLFPLSPTTSMGMGLGRMRMGLGLFPLSHVLTMPA